MIAVAKEVMVVNSLSVYSKESTLVSVDSKGVTKSAAPANQSKSKQVAAVAQIGPAERMKVSGKGPAQLIISEAVTAHLEPGTEIEVPKVEKDQKPTSSLRLLKGKMFITVDAEKLRANGNLEFRLETPKSLLAVRGTRFVAATEEQADAIILVEGSLAVRDQTTKEFVTLRPGQATTVSGKGKLEPRRLSQEESLYSKVFEDRKLTFVPYKIERDSLSTAKTEFADRAGGLEAKYRSSAILIFFKLQNRPNTEGLYHLAFKPRRLRIDSEKVVGLIVGVRTQYSPRNGLSLEPEITFNLACIEDSLLTGSAKVPLPVGGNGLFVPGPKVVRTFFVPAGMIKAKSLKELETWRSELGAELFANAVVKERHEGGTYVHF